MGGPTYPALASSRIHAMHDDALNAISPEYESNDNEGRVAAADPIAAVAAAAHGS